MSEDRSVGAIGLTAFAGVIMFLLGGWWIMAGLVALVSDDFYVVTREWIFEFDATIWGWTHLILGVVVGFAGISVFVGEVWARAVGVILAVISGLVAFAWLPYYPVWAVLIVALSVFTVWALTAHGRDITMGYEDA